MMDPMKHEMQISNKFAIWKIFLRVKDKTMKAVLDQWEEEKATESSQHKGEEVESLPGRNRVKHVRNDEKRK